jgi:hypothetical protein
MTDYIVCQRKRNNPRMNIRVCQHKCPDKETCEAFVSRHGTGSEAKHPTLERKSRPIEIGAA